MDEEMKAPASRARPLAGGLTVFAAVLRLVPHPANLTPVGALGLYGGARLPLAQALALPLALMALTDVILHYAVYPGYPPFHPWVYASLAVNVLLGRLLLRRTQAPAKVVAVTLLASLQFFLVTNFGAWLGSPLYPQDLGGLAACYTAALPFYGQQVPPPFGFLGNAVAGDLLFSTALFGLHAWLARVAFPAERVTTVTRAAS
jgi:hypothetical protein